MSSDYKIGDKFMFIGDASEIYEAYNSDEDSIINYKEATKLAFRCYGKVWVYRRENVFHKLIHEAEFTLWTKQELDKLFKKVS